jgi:catechol 2,3-dioxygenase-like lactoylglutathione lyase family enzyme
LGVLWQILSAHFVLRRISKEVSTKCKKDVSPGCQGESRDPVTAVGATKHKPPSEQETVHSWKINHTCFRIAPLQDFITRLTKAGIAYEDLQGTPGAITLRPDGIRQIYFRDPDGYWIEMNDGKQGRYSVSSVS